MTGLFTQPAAKERLLARVAIDGPTGAGKTWTALQLARILAGPDGIVGVADTENRSAAYYAPTPGVKADRMNPWDPPYEFMHLPMTMPYDPRQLAVIIDAAGEELSPEGKPPGVLVIDSLTHFWNGEGGTLDIVDHAAQRARGNSFAGWQEGTPAQRFMLDKIIHAKCHVVVTMRSKMEYVLETGPNGKQTPRKVGMAPEQRAGIEYEFTVVADMDLEHRMVVSKSRCDLVADAVAVKGRSAEVWQTFTEWLAIGVERISADDAAGLAAMMNTMTDEEARKDLKYEFIQEFGRPSEMATDHLEAARAWLAGKIPQPAAEPVIVGALADALADVAEDGLPVQPEFDVDGEG